MQQHITGVMVLMIIDLVVICFMGTTKLVAFCFISKKIITSKMVYKKAHLINQVSSY